MLVVFVHGWSVTNTDTYGGLPAALTATTLKQLDITVQHLHLAKYVSFSDEVNVDDIARGMQAAVTAEVLPKLAKGEGFACITHSTGGPVVRKWIDLFFGSKLAKCPLRHLVMLAPANHGSALAQLGKGKLARMKFFMDGVQPGTGVLDWLELGSEPGWQLNQAWLDYDCTGAGLYAFVLTGQTIDRGFYDNLNSYTGEAGSDGVVRVAAANMNYGLIRLVQQEGEFVLSKEGKTQPTALGVLPGLAHSGAEKGILRSVQAGSGDAHPTVKWVGKCLAVRSASAYRSLLAELAAETARTQKAENKVRTREGFLFSRTFVTNRYCMLVFRIVDDRGSALSDYDITFLAGPRYDPDHLPPGFFVDRQRNSKSPGRLTYYIDYDVMAAWFEKPALEGRFGFRVTARPSSGYAFYTVAEHRGTFASLRKYFEPNQTLMIEMQLARHVAEGVFRLTQNLSPEDFRGQPKGRPLS